jgi:DNA primase
MILCVFLAHPEVLQTHAETLAEIDLEGHIARQVRNLLLDGAAGGEAIDPTVMNARLERAGLKEAAERLTALVRPGDRWTLDPHADPLRLEDALRQAITLHRRGRTLHSELRAAERALAEEDNEANLAWLREVQNQLSSAEGAEADLDNGVVHRDH